MNIDEKKLKELQEVLPSLNELNVLEYLWNSESRGCIFDDLYDRYLIDDGYCYSEDSEEINTIESHIIERFGEHYALAIKNEEYILISFVGIDDDIKYWSILKIDVNEQEMARKIVYLISFVDENS